MEDYPKVIQTYINNQTMKECSCHSSAKVYQLGSGDYLKIDKKSALYQEQKQTHLMNTYGFGAKVLTYVSEEYDYLITEKIDGNPLTSYVSNPKLCCEILASALKKLHITKTKNMPISILMEEYLHQDVMPVFQPKYLISKVKNLDENRLNQLYQSIKSYLEIDTLIHGDACLPNVMVKDSMFYNFLDMAYCGLGDKHYDLYWAIWSLEMNLETDEYTDYFLECYGKENIDEAKFEVMAVLAMC